MRRVDRHSVTTNRDLLPYKILMTLCSFNLLDLPSPTAGLVGRSVEPVMMRDFGKHYIFRAANFSDLHVSSFSAADPKNVSRGRDQFECSILLHWSFRWIFHFQTFFSNHTASSTEHGSWRSN
jgi:hypothetical protein